MLWRLLCIISLACDKNFVLNILYNKLINFVLQQTALLSALLNEWMKMYLYQIKTHVK